MKTCRTCKNELPREEFNRSACHADKLNSECKECDATRRNRNRYKSVPLKKELTKTEFVFAQNIIKPLF